MANREALRELQTRLANRLQNVKSDGKSVEWLAVKSSGLSYLLPLNQSGEIFPTTQVKHVPYSKEWFLGVLNVRGNLFGVVSLADFIVHDAGQEAPVKKSMPTSDASVITLNAILDINCALQVDALSGLRSSDAFKASEKHAPGKMPSYFGNLFVDHEGKSWQEINLQALSQSPAFLSIGA